MSCFDRGPFEMFFGLDLQFAIAKGAGRKDHDYSALAALHRTVPTEVRRITDGAAHRDVPRTLPSILTLRGLDRTRYVPLPQVLEKIVPIVERPGIKGRCVVAFDATQAQGPISGMIQDALPCPTVPLFVHPGGSFRLDAGLWRVPKSHLVGALKMLELRNRIRYVEGIPMLAELKQEMENFSCELNEGNGSDSYGASRGHDDLVACLSFAAWLALQEGLWQPFSSRGSSESYCGITGQRLAPDDTRLF